MSGLLPLRTLGWCQSGGDDELLAGVGMASCVVPASGVISSSPSCELLRDPLRKFAGNPIDTVLFAHTWHYLPFPVSLRQTTVVNSGTGARDKHNRVRGVKSGTGAIDKTR